MPTYKRVGIILAVFSITLLAWNIATPENEDHIKNIIGHFVLAIMLIESILVNHISSKYVQVIAMFWGAFFVAIDGDMQPSAAVGSVAVMLSYFYSGLQPFKPSFLIIASCAQFILTFIAALISGYAPLVSIGHAVLWSLAPLVFVWILWFVMRDFAEDLIRQNRDLLEINKELMEERHVSKRA